MRQENKNREQQRQLEEPEQQPARRDVEEPAWEEALHAYVDGELDDEEARAFERRLADHPEMQERLHALRAVDDWLGATRAVPPPSLARSVERAVAAAAHADATRTTAAETDAPVHAGAAARIDAVAARRDASSPTTWQRLTGWIHGLRLTPAPALVAVILLLLVIYGDDLRHRSAAPTARRRAAAGDAATPAGSDDGAAAVIAHAFSLLAPDAGTVCLVGSFNQWTVCQTPLVHRPDGSWATSVELPHGRYEYMFVVDGQWVTDPDAALVVDDGFGNRNAVLFL